MAQSRRRAVVEAFVLAGMLGIASSAVAETKTYCDNKCGDTQPCKYICCHITTETVEGVDIVTKVSCSTSTCGAQRCSRTGVLGGGGTFKIPALVIEGVSGPVKGALTEVGGLDASAIMVETDESAKTVALAGTVATAAQRDQAIAAARKHSPGYKVVDRLTVSPAAQSKQ
jgi:hypothetical protein